MTHAAAKTGLIPTVLVAIEQSYPENKRIISDNLALSMLPSGMRAFVLLMRFSAVREWVINAVEKRSPGIWAGLMCRKRYIDEKLFQPDHEVEAIVNLGAGFDTRVYRLAGSATLPIWEFDLPDNIAKKKKRLSAFFEQLPTHIQLVSIDFDTDDLNLLLSANGYSSDKQTFFIWEAVSQFLTETGIQNTLNFLSKAPQGSRLVFTYILKEFLTGDALYGQEKTYQQAVEKGFWLFGLHPDEVSSFLGSNGWEVSEHLGYDELADRYLEPTGRNLSALPIERIVLAVKGPKS